MKADHEIDAAGLLCPLPVLRARKYLAGARGGTTLRLIATDAMAEIDIPHFCDQTGYAFLGASDTRIAGHPARAYLIHKPA